MVLALTAGVAVATVKFGTQRCVFIISRQRKREAGTLK
jgi:hypothetical protein